MILSPPEQPAENGFSCRKMRFPTEKNIFLQKNALSCRKISLPAEKCTFLQKNAVFGRARGRKLQEIAGGFLCQSQLAEKQHEQILLYNFGFLNLQCYFGEAVCTGLFRTDFLHGFSARIFCTDFLHGFSARMFCTEFLHGFFVQIFCTVFCPILLRGFLHGLLARIVCTDVARIFAGIFLCVPKHLLGSAKISPRKSPEKFTMLWGPSGAGLGRQEGEVRLWPA